ncbi:hypothetical protein ECZU03_32670 [Escherichia coli]|nr:hypothetical protein ECZU03_32670 [Escherichia coli]
MRPGRPCICGEVLVTAQHLDDQCETFLLALKRGSGPAGLSAMAEVSSLPEHGLSAVARPHAGELEQWALAHGLRWIEDESNQDDSYDRNFLRLRVVPLLQQRWPHLPKQRPAAPHFVLNKRACWMNCWRMI